MGSWMCRLCLEFLHGDTFFFLLPGYLADRHETEAYLFIYFSLFPSHKPGFVSLRYTVSPQLCFLDWRIMGRFGGIFFPKPMSSPNNTFKWINKRVWSQVGRPKAREGYCFAGKNCTYINFVLIDELSPERSWMHGAIFGGGGHM